jgi:hypothetical protein
VAPTPISELAKEAREGKVATPSSELKETKQKSNLKLRERYANALLVVLTVQLAVADGVFIKYAATGVHWNVAEPIMGAWLGAAVIQVIGVVLVVTRNLFPPPRGSGR